MLGLYRAIVVTLAATPHELLDLAGRLWVPELSHLVPLQNKFLWLNLAVPDPLYILPVLVVVTTWLQQKLIMPAAPSSGGGDKKADQAAQISRQMMVIMPLMFGFFSLSFASGLSIYFIASNFIGIGQYGMMGKIDVRRMVGLKSDAPAEPEKRADKPKRDVEVAPPAKAKRVPAAKAKRSGIYDSRAQRAKAKSKAKG
jgi:YidC/Oxa1 family membrane protein insertase